MEDILKNIIIGDLLDVYGKLLTKRQAKLLDLHYNQDLSLAEIAEQEETSRQAVHDALRRGEKSLKDFEEGLKVLERRRLIREKLPSYLDRIARWTLNEEDELERAELLAAIGMMIEEESNGI